MASLALTFLLGIVLACGSDDDDGAPSGASDGALSGEVTVYAAASLTDAFTELEKLFEAEHPDLDVVFSFGGTPTLRTQLEQGARAGVFASANLEQMELARQNGVVETAASVFARNSLVIITPADNPGGIESPEDLAQDGLKLVLANEDVPVGAYTRQMLDAMDADAGFGAGFKHRVLDNVVSLESSVKQVVAKVELGEADGGVVYGSDVTPSVAPRVRPYPVPDRFNVIAEYPIALVKDRRNDAAARAFIEFVLSPVGQAVLEKHGFLGAA